MPKNRLWTFIVIATAICSLSSIAHAALEDVSAAPDAVLYGSATVFHRGTAAFPQWTDVMQRAADKTRTKRVCAIVRDTDLGVDHAVLLADVDGRSYLLDNLQPRIVSAAWRCDTAPIMRST